MRISGALKLVLVAALLIIIHNALLYASTYYTCICAVLYRYTLILHPYNMCTYMHMCTHANTIIASYIHIHLYCIQQLHIHTLQNNTANSWHIAGAHMFTRWTTKPAIQGGWSITGLTGRLRGSYKLIMHVHIQ